MNKSRSFSNTLVLTLRITITINIIAKGDLKYTKKIIYNLLGTILCIVIITKNALIQETFLKTSLLFIKQVAPSLVSFYTISTLLTLGELDTHLYKITKSSKLAYWITCNLLPIPSSAYYIKEKPLSNSKKDHILNTLFLINPLFLYTFLVKITSTQNAIYILIGTNLWNLLYFSKKNIPYEIRTSQITISSYISGLTSILTNAYLTIIPIHIGIQLLPKTMIGLGGFLELTYGLNYLASTNIEENNKIILAVAYILFGGISFQIQSTTALQKKSIKSMLFTRTKITLTGLLIMILLLVLK